MPIFATHRAVSRRAAGRLSPRAIATSRKRAEAIKLRAAGETFEQIAEIIGVTTGRAHQLVDEALRHSAAGAHGPLRLSEEAAALLLPLHDRPFSS